MRSLAFIVLLCLDVFFVSHIGHVDVLTIDLSAVQANWLYISSISQSVAVGGVIKANAYGLGASQVGSALYSVGCREFFVSTLDEALFAREFLPSDSFVYVLGGPRIGEVQEFIKANLIPVLCSLAQIKDWAQQNQQQSYAYPSAVKLNTGMTRFGLDIYEFKSLCCNADLIKAINPVLLMSHLACADDPTHRLNSSQQQQFADCAAHVRNILPSIRLSLANSSGIFLGSRWHYDLVRPGAALYGINPQPLHSNPMKSVVSLSLPIIQVRTMEDDVTLGYAAEAFLPKGRRVAVVAGGYADGLHRTLGGQPEGDLCGHRVQAVGRISMDATIFDISGVQLSSEQLLGKSIEVINECFTLDYLSNKNHLLGYEVLTSLGARYKRRYLSGVNHD